MVTWAGGAGCSWRKIKQDLKSELTEASLTGAAVSIGTGILILYLVFSQVGVGTQNR